MTERDELRELRRQATAVARRLWGRGPERCEAHWAGRDLLVLVFHGGLTPAEITLKEAGDASEARRFRDDLRRCAEPELRSHVERLTGRIVSTVLGSSQVEPAVTAELFLLAPPGSGAGLAQRVEVAERPVGELADTSASEIGAAGAVLEEAAEARLHTRTLRETARSEDRQGASPVHEIKQP